MDDELETRHEAADRIAGLSRRELMAAITAVGAAATLGVPDRAFAASAKATARRETTARSARSAAPVSRSQAFADRLAATKPHGHDLGAIDHVVFLMLENRSYDHYFGAYPKGRGFDDHPKHSLHNFAQDFPGGKKLSPRKKLLPFHLAVNHDEDCTHDLTHNWGPMHECWNRGKMDSWVKVHTNSRYEGSDGAMTMGYHLRKDLPLHWALADNFTLCDAYHASILGPTHPNRLMAQTGTIDPAGLHGGPITDTNSNPDYLWSCTWTTVQELLEDKGVPWKVYHPSNVGVTGKYAPLADFETWGPFFYDPVHNPLVMALSDHVLPYFKAFKHQKSPLHQKAFNPTFPNDFLADIANDTLPKVSWIIPPLGFDEHPSSSSTRGQWFTQQVLDALMADRKIWAKTAVFIMYDENDGWFDHVTPPTAPKGTRNEWLTAKTISSETNGIRGPLGLGVRVPMLVVSPFSRGGHISSELFDHTSQLQFLAERFGIEVPHVSKWRRETVGDLTSALFRGKRDMSMPALPTMDLGPSMPSGNCEAEDIEGGGADPSYPTKQRMPTQRGKTIPASRFFAEAPTATERVSLRSGKSTATKKSAANALAEGKEMPTVSPKHNR